METFRRVPTPGQKVKVSRLKRMAQIIDALNESKTANSTDNKNNSNNSNTTYRRDSLSDENPQREGDNFNKGSVESQNLAIYVASCRKDRVIPLSYFVRHMNEEKLSLRHCQLAVNEIRPIAYSLQNNTHITSLDLSDNRLGVEGVKWLCLLLKDNCFITHLNISENYIGKGVGGAEAVSELLLHNRNIRDVNLSANGFDDTAADHLARVIRDNGYLERINLSQNELGEYSGSTLGPALADNVSLQSLSLKWNCLRRHGAVVIATGMRHNVYMTELDISWNGFGVDGCKELSKMLIENHTLTSLDVSNNRITTEAAVHFSHGLSKNQSLQVLKMGKNPMQSAGCWSVCSALIKNPHGMIKQLDFTDIKVNEDFDELFSQLKLQCPDVKLFHGGMEPPPKPKARLHPMVKLQSYIDKHQLKLIDFFQRFDKDGSMSVSHEEFAEGIHEMGIKLDDDEIQLLVDELDKDGDGEINYSEMVIGNQEFNEREKKSRQPGTVSYN